MLNKSNQNPWGVGGLGPGCPPVVKRRLESVSEVLGTREHPPILPSFLDQRMTPISTVSFAAIDC